MPDSAPPIDQTNHFFKSLWIMIKKGHILFLLFPIIAWFIDAAYNFALTQKVEHLFQSLTKIALVQCLVLSASAYSQRRTSGFKPLFSVIMAALLAVILFTYVGLQHQKEKTTINHVKQIISEIEFKEAMISKDVIMQLAEVLVDEDYQPESIPNKLSNYYRKDKRELFSKIVNSISTEKKIDPNDLLLQHNKTMFNNRLYNFLGVVVILVFIIYLIVYFTHIYQDRTPE